MKRLDKILEGCGVVDIRGSISREITALVCDSRKVVPGCAFVAVDGYACDGHDFVESAVEKGAEVIIYSNGEKLSRVLENIDNAAKDNRQNYQKLQLWFRQLATMLRESDITIYATAHQVDNGTGGLTGAGRYGADMNEKTFNAFTSVFDFVGRLYVKDDQRWIDCDPESGNHGKNRIDGRKNFHAEELIEPKEEQETQEDKQEKGVA